MTFCNDTLMLAMVNHFQFTKAPADIKLQRKFTLCKCNLQVLKAPLVPCSICKGQVP